MLISFLFLIFDTPVYSKDFSPKVIEKYNLKISRKFSNTYCNSTKFGISKDGALEFAIGETNKEFKNNKLNKFIDYKNLKENILLNIENNCQIFDFPLSELDNLTFKY
tara:strand:- start:286 stop:609 length:324 start_codon:yes stop_codon:yes gene_type:complete